MVVPVFQSARQPPTIYAKWQEVMAALEATRESDLTAADFKSHGALAARRCPLVLLELEQALSIAQLKFISRVAVCVKQLR